MSNEHHIEEEGVGEIAFEMSTGMGKDSEGRPIYILMINGLSFLFTPEGWSMLQDQIKPPTQ